MHLTWDEIAPVAKPSVDRGSVLFDHEGTLYRGFQGEQAKVIETTLRPEIYRDLASAGVVSFCRSDLSVDGFPVVVAVETVPRVTYPPEWPTVALGDAARVTAALQRRLLRHGLMLKDAHPWNLLFDGTQARFIDLGSIVAYRGQVPQRWYREFRRHMVVPLALHRLGAHAAADAIVSEHMGPLKRLMDLPVAAPFPLRHWIGTRRGLSDAERMARLVEMVEELGARARTAPWTAYDQHEVPMDDETAYNGKQSAIRAYLSDEPPSTLTDLAANRGWFTELASSLGHRVIAIDVDDGALRVLWSRCRERGLHVDVVRADVIRPPGSHGVALVYDDFYRRMRSDILLAPAILHHLVGKQDVSFELFARVADRLAARTAIVEFVPRDDQHVSHWPLAHESWYEPENFVRAMAPFFPRVDVVPSSPAPRLMYRFRR